MDIDGKNIKTTPNRPAFHVDQELIRAAKQAAKVFAQEEKHAWKLAQKDD